MSDQDQPGNDSPAPPPESPKTLEVQIADDLSDEVSQFISLPPWPPPAVVKEETAKWVALGLVVIFGVLTTLALIGGFFIIRCSGCSPETAKQTITDSAIPFLKEVGTFAQTVFGPLLAFILGYYFATHKKAAE